MMIKETKRRVVSLTPNQWKSLSALATVSNTSTAALVRGILDDFIDLHRNEIEAAEGIVRNFQRSIEAYREKNPAE